MPDTRTVEIPGGLKADIAVVSPADLHHDTRTCTFCTRHIRQTPLLSLTLYGGAFEATIRVCPTCLIAAGVREMLAEVQT